MKCNDKVLELIQDVGFYFGKLQYYYGFIVVVYGFGLIICNEKIWEIGVLLIVLVIIVGLIQMVSKIVVGWVCFSIGVGNSEFDFFNSMFDYYFFFSGYVILVFIMVYVLVK